MGLFGSIGKALGGAVRGARKGISAIGNVASKAAPLAGMVPGLGTVAGGLLGLGGGLVSGQGIGGSLKRGLVGAAGAGLGSALSGGAGLPGIAKRIGGALRLGGGGGQTPFGSGTDAGNVDASNVGGMQSGFGNLTSDQVLAMRRAGIVPGQGGGQSGGGGGGGILGGIGRFLTQGGGGGQGGGGMSPLGMLLTGGAGAASMIGAGKEREKEADFQNQMLDLQRNRMDMANQEFQRGAPAREAAQSRLISAVNRQPSGIFATSRQRGKQAGFIGGENG